MRELLDEQCELALQDEVDLLLMLVRMNAPSLTRLEDD